MSYRRRILCYTLWDFINFLEIVCTGTMCIVGRKLDKFDRFLHTISNVMRKFDIWMTQRKLLDRVASIDNCSAKNTCFHWHLVIKLYTHMHVRLHTYTLTHNFNKNNNTCGIQLFNEIREKAIFYSVNKRSLSKYDKCLTFFPIYLLVHLSTFFCISRLFFAFENFFRVLSLFSAC